MEKHTKNDAEKQDVTAYAMIPVWMIRGGKGVTHGALRLYAAIKTYTKNGQNVAWPSQKTLADDMGVSERQVRTMMHQLEDCGGVQVELLRNDDGTRGRNYVYTLAWEQPFAKHRKDTSDDSAEKNFHSPASDGETVEESFRSIAEENFPSIPEESCRLTTPTEHTLNSTRENPLGKVPLRSVDKLFSEEEFNERVLHASRQQDEEKKAVPPPPDTSELLDQLWPERRGKKAS